MPSNLAERVFVWTKMCQKAELCSLVCSSCVRLPRKRCLQCAQTSVLQSLQSRDLRLEWPMESQILFGDPPRKRMTRKVRRRSAVSGRVLVPETLWDSLQAAISANFAVVRHLALPAHWRDCQLTKARGSRT